MGKANPFRTGGAKFPLLHRALTPDSLADKLESFINFGAGNLSCGFSGFADHIAARNVASRAVVNPPNVAHAEAKAVERFTVPTELWSSAFPSHPLRAGGS